VYSKLCWCTGDIFLDIKDSCINLHAFEHTILTRINLTQVISVAPRDSQI